MDNFERPPTTWRVSCLGVGMRLNLKRLALLSGKCARVFAERAGLTPQRVDMLLLLRGFRLTQKEIAWRLCVSPPVVSRMLSALEDLELVYRAGDRADRRRRIPQLTDAGQARLARCFPEPTTRGAQTTGEATWLATWRPWLAQQLGLRVDSMLRARPPAPDCYEVFAAWNRRYGRDLELRNEIPNYYPRRVVVGSCVATRHAETTASPA